MLGSKGVITVQGDRKMAYACDRKSLELVNEFWTRETNLSAMQVKHSRPKMAPKPFDQTKEVPLSKYAPLESTNTSSRSGNANPSIQKVLVRAGLDPK